MNLTIKATNSVLTLSIRDYLNKKLNKFEKFLKPQNKVHVELQDDAKHSSGAKFRVEITITSKPTIYADAYGNDFFEAIDLCIPKVKEQLMKSKDKKLSLRRKMGARIKGNI